jgi:hypothetical protein
MEMGYRDHIVAKLSALAVAGGTTAMLFAASPVHTAFSATTSGSLSASGATVAQTLTNGNLTASGLLPGVDTNSALVSVQNKGSVAETFTLNFKGVTGMGGSIGLPNYSALQQLESSDTAYSCTQQVAKPANYIGTLSSVLPSSSSSTYTPLFPGVTSNDRAGLSISQAIAHAVPVGHFVEISVYLKLSGTSMITGTSMGGPNAWDGKSVTIPYTITAEPAASTSTSPTLKPTGPGSQPIGAA